MKIISYVLGAVLSLAGIIWILQGSNIVKGASLSGQTTWLYLGIMALIAGATMFYYARSVLTPPAPPKDPTKE